LPDPGTDANRKVAIIGGGTIGVGWAIVFARSGFDVSIFEPDRNRRSRLIDEAKRRLEDLHSYGLIDEPVPEVLHRMSPTTDLQAAVIGTVHVQECVPESADLKRGIFAEALRVAGPATTVGSSSSAIPVSAVAQDLAGRGRCLVAHPGNPPYLLPVVEVVPASFTEPETIDSVMQLMSAAGMLPVKVNFEIEGFVFNRLQGALLREAYCLVRDGVISPAEVDLVVTNGLGRRWSVIGPFATAELNTRGGIRAHAERLGPAYARMGAERGQDDPWNPELVEQVAADLESRYPSSDWEAHVLQRDLELMKLEANRRRTAVHTSPSQQT
jgi:3-hydroxyacyl-CoA dehydrogenase